MKVENISVTAIVEYNHDWYIVRSFDEEKETAVCVHIGYWFEHEFDIKDLILKGNVHENWED